MIQFKTGYKIKGLAPYLRPVMAFIEKNMLGN
jgi:hypothetical protein